MLGLVYECGIWRKLKDLTSLSAILTRQVVAFIYLSLGASRITKTKLNKGLVAQLS